MVAMARNRSLTLQGLAVASVDFDHHEEWSIGEATLRASTYVDGRGRVPEAPLQRKYDSRSQAGATISTGIAAGCAR